MNCEIIRLDLSARQNPARPVAELQVRKKADIVGRRPAEP